MELGFIIEFEFEFCRKWHSRASRFQNFLWEYVPRSPMGEGPYEP